MPLQAAVVAAGVVVVVVLDFLQATIENTAITTNEVSNEVIIFIRLIFSKIIYPCTRAQYTKGGNLPSVLMGIRFTPYPQITL